MKLPAVSLLDGPSERSLSLFSLLKRTFLLLATANLGFVVLAALAFLGVQLRGFLRESSYFSIETIEIKGASTILEGQVREALAGLSQTEQSNLLLLPVADAQGRIQSLPRVRKVSLEKEFPRTLHVNLEERSPITAVNVGEFYWIDSEGFLLGPAAPREILEAKTPLVTGLRGSEFRPGIQLRQPMLSETLETIRFLQENDPALAQEFSEWHLSAQDEVIGVLNHGVEVRFGESHPLARIPVLASVLRRRTDLDRLTYLDLRFDSQVVYF